MPSQEVATEAVTRVVYMPGRSFRSFAEERLRAGDGADLPCCVISRAAQPDQSIQWSTLRELGEVVPGPAPVLLLTGWALADAAACDAGGDARVSERPPATSEYSPAHDL
jgi:siroheme synthase